jgi:hypothetical protein
MARLIADIKDDIKTYKSRNFVSGKYDIGSVDSDEPSQAQRDLNLSEEEKKDLENDSPERYAAMMDEEATPSLAKNENIKIEFENDSKSKVNLSNKPCSTAQRFFDDSLSKTKNSQIASGNKNALTVVEAIMNPASNHTPKINPEPNTLEEKLEMVLQIFQAEGLIDPNDVGSEFEQLKTPAEKFAKMKVLMQSQLQANQSKTGCDVSDEMQFMDSFLFENDQLNKGLEPYPSGLLDKQDADAKTTKNNTPTSSQKNAKVAGAGYGLG